MIWKLAGLAEYDARRQLTSTGTHQLGMVEHLSMVATTFLGDASGRPFEQLSWGIDHVARAERAARLTDTPPDPPSR